MTTLEIIGNVSNFFGTFGGLAAIALWLGQRRAKKLAEVTVKVCLRIEAEGREIVLPLEIIRRDVSRAELLGRIGSIPMRKPGTRFALRNIGTPAVMREINRVSRGETNLLAIPASIEEVEQFDL